MEQETSKDSLKYQLLRLLAIRINSSAPIKEIIQEGIDKTLEIMGLEAGSIALWDEDTKELIYEAISGKPDKADFLSAIEKSAIQTMRKDFKIESIYLTLQKDGLYSLFSYPIRADGRLLGAITGLSSGNRNLILEEEFLEALGSQLGLGVSKAEGYLTKAEKRKMEEEKEQALKSEMLSAITLTSGTVNHEINNPLTAILGNAQLLLARKEYLDQETVEKLKKIEENALKIEEVTHNLLRIIEPVIVEYAPGVKIIDLAGSKKREFSSES
ncbi:MAG: histidine kinase dimerization/phospho-acceptor domain-containing protein [Candidatus Zixiibacteriota bacterium]